MGLFDLFSAPDHQVTRSALEEADALDGTDFEGKTIGVNVAKPKADRPAGGYGGGNRGGGYGGGYGNRRY